MSTWLMLVAAVLLGAGAQDPAKPVFPKKSGVFAMTAEGPVELKVSGEPNQVEKSTTFRCFYAPKDYDKIPTVSSLQSFYVSAMGWAPRDLYIIVGRDMLSNPSEKYQRLRGRAVTQGAIAFQVVSADLESPAFVEQAITRLSTDPTAEAYVVLELTSTAGLSNRSYPVKLERPKK
jgi:hypothetical protein